MQTKFILSLAIIPYKKSICDKVQKLTEQSNLYSRSTDTMYYHYNEYKHFQ